MYAGVSLLQALLIRVTYGESTMKLTKIIIKKRIINEITQNLIKNINMDFNTMYNGVNSLAYKDLTTKTKKSKRDAQIQYLKYFSFK